MLPSTTPRWSRTPQTLPGLRNELDRLFEDFFQGPTGRSGGVRPAADLYETDESYVVELELPGFHRDEIDVAVEEGMLTVSGRRTAESAEDEDYHLRERASGRFSRSFSLPASIEASDVSARFDNGVLRVTLPKAEEARTRKIEVDVA